MRSQLVRPVLVVAGVALGAASLIGLAAGIVIDELLQQRRRVLGDAGQHRV